MKKLAMLALLLTLTLAACQAANPSPTPSAPIKTTTAAATAAPSPTLLLLTATPAPSKVLLVTGDSGAAADPAAVKAALAELSAPAKWVVEERKALQVAELNPQVKVAVLLVQPANLAELMAASPTTQFILLTAADMPAKGTLSVVRANPEHLAFVAGFIAAIISPDWRAAGLLPDQPKTLLEAFQNGGRWFCGRCAPNFAPVVFFPVGAALPAGSGLAAAQAAYEGLKKNVLQTVYVPAEIGTPEVLEYVNAQKVTLIGGKAPSEALKPRWAVTVRQDALAALRGLWVEVVGGKGGKAVSAAITFSDINESLFSPGRQRLAQEVIAGLADGSISPLAVAP